MGLRIAPVLPANGISVDGCREGVFGAADAVPVLDLVPRSLSVLRSHAIYEVPWRNGVVGVSTSGRALGQTTANRFSHVGG